MILRDESWYVNRVLIKDVNRILKYLYLKHDFSFIDQSNCWILSNGDLDSSLFFRDPRHLIEENSIALTNNIYFSSNTGKRYSYSDTCKNDASVCFALTLNEADFPPLPPTIHAHKCKYTPYSNNCNRDLCETHDSYYVSSTSKPVGTKTVCKPVPIVSCNKPVISSPVYKSLRASNILLVTLFIAVLAVDLYAWCSGMHL